MQFVYYSEITLDSLCECVSGGERGGEREKGNERDKLRGVSSPPLFSLSRLVIRFISGA